MRRPAAAPFAVPVVNTANADEELTPVNDEEALRKVVDKYLEPASASKNVSVGMGLCLDLSILYLEQHRLDDAEKLFDRLAKVPDVRPYRTLGRFGGSHRVCTPRQGTGIEQGIPRHNRHRSTLGRRCQAHEREQGGTWQREKSRTCEREQNRAGIPQDVDQSVLPLLVGPGDKL